VHGSSQSWNMMGIVLRHCQSVSIINNHVAVHNDRI
jgi:hypothetical protein